MIYIVCGTRRSGTSMLMRCVAESSALVPVVGERQAAIHSEFQGQPYDANPNGYYEADWMSEEQQHPELLPDGALIKVFPSRMLLLRPAEYRVCFIYRSLTEIKMSHLAAFGEAAAVESEYDDLDRARAICEVRRDTEVAVLHYSRVLADPLTAFAGLEVRGWPIRPDLAASFVDPNLYRNRAPS